MNDVVVSHEAVFLATRITLLKVRGRWCFLWPFCTFIDRFTWRLPLLKVRAFWCFLWPIFTVGVLVARCTIRLPLLKVGRCLCFLSPFCTIAVVIALFTWVITGIVLLKVRTCYISWPLSTIVVIIARCTCWLTVIHFIIFLIYVFFWFFNGLTKCLYFFFILRFLSWLFRGFLAIFV